MGVAGKLAGDFGVPTDVTVVPIRYPRARQNQARLDELRCRRALQDYLHLQQRLVRTYAPKSTSAGFSAQFVTACQQRDRAMGLLAGGDESRSYAQHELRFRAYIRTGWLGLTPIGGISWVYRS